MEIHESIIIHPICSRKETSIFSVEQLNCSSSSADAAVNFSSPCMVQFFLDEHINQTKQHCN